MRVRLSIVILVFFINHSFINGLKAGQRQASTGFKDSVSRMISGGFQSLRNLSSKSYGSFRSFSDSKFSFRSDSSMTERTNIDRESWQAQKLASGVKDKVKRAATFGSSSLKAFASGVVEGVRRRTSRQRSQELESSDGDIELCYDLPIGTEVQLPKSTCTIASPCFPEQDVAYTVEISSTPRCSCTPTPPSSPRRSPTGSPRSSPTGSPSRSPPRGRSDSPKSRSPERSRSSSPERRGRTSPDQTIKSPPEISGQKSPDDLPRKGGLKKQSKQSPAGSRDVLPKPTLQFTDTSHVTKIPSCPNKPLPPPGSPKPSISPPRGLTELPKISTDALKTSSSKKWSPPKTPQKSPPKSPPKPSTKSPPKPSTKSPPKSPPKSPSKSPPKSPSKSPPKSPPKPVDPHLPPPPHKFFPHWQWRKEIQSKGIPEPQPEPQPQPPAPRPPPPPGAPRSPPRMFKFPLLNWRDGIGQRMKHFVPAAAPNIDPDDPHQVAYFHFQNKLLRYFAMHSPPNREVFRQELSDLHDEQFKPRTIDQETRSREWIEENCGPLRDEDRVALINSPALKRQCIKRCHKTWGFAFIPSSDEDPLDPVEFFACGRLVPITNGDVARDPEPYIDVDNLPVFACDCKIDWGFYSLMSAFRVNSVQFNNIKNDPNTTVESAVDWLKQAFWGTGVRILSHEEYQMQWKLLFRKRNWPDPEQYAYHRIEQGRAAGGEDNEKADEHYWENMKFYKDPLPPHPTRAPSTLTDKEKKEK